MLKQIAQIKNLYSVLVISMLAMVFIFFAFIYPYHLFFLEQMQLFMLTPEHFYSYFNKPAAISSYLGDFFTQFYFLKAGGAIVITFCLAILFSIVNKIIKAFGNNKLLKLIPILFFIIVALLHTNVHYSLASTLALIFAMLFIWGYTCLKNEIVRVVSGLFFIPILYYIAGAYVLIYTLGIILYEIKLKKLKATILVAYISLTVILTITTPLTLRSSYYITKKQAFLYPGNQHISILPDFELEKILSLSSEWYFNRPEKVIELAKKYQLKNKFTSYYYNLAHSALNKLPDGLMEIYQPASNALFLSVDKTMNYMGIAFSNEVYYLIGDVNAAQHSSLLATTFSPKNQSSRMIRRLVEINIINQEYEAAEKYIKMLKKTWFHKSWAEEISKYLYNEQECSKSNWIVWKRAQIPITDFIKEAPNDYLATLKHLLRDHPGNKTSLDYLLCTYILNKDLDSFYHTIIEEIKSKRLNPLPTLYQEALLIYFSQHINDENKNLVNFSPLIFKSFINYTDIYAANKGDGAALQQDYGKTYWFYYHYATQKSQTK